MKTKNNKEIYMGSYGYLNIKTSEIVESKNQLRLKTGDDKYEILEVKVSADFSTIPEKYREVFLNIFSARYMDSVSFGDNPFSQCVPPPKKKWWQFWKANLTI
jgi:hypothetical protein